MLTRRDGQRVASFLPMSSSAKIAIPLIEPKAPALPRRCGPYTLVSPVGRGGMTDLFLARPSNELGANRLVVVKLIVAAFADDPRMHEMLVHEAKLASGLSHRSIVQVHDLGRDEGHVYIAMEYVEGLDLHAIVREGNARGAALPAELALVIVADVIDALDYAHRRTVPTKAGGVRPLGLVHRDVSPSNILVSFDGEVKLCDFGIAYASELARDSESEILKGKAAYMSPEHARGEAVDARADIFSAGVVLWELLARRRLYRARAEVSLLEQARRAEIPPLPSTGLPHEHELERVVRKALAKDRADRYASAGDFRRDLEAYLAHAEIHANCIELGAWMASTFHVEFLEKRRASDLSQAEQLTTPPPAPLLSGTIRRSHPEAKRAVVPAPPRLPVELLPTSHAKAKEASTARVVTATLAAFVVVALLTAAYWMVLR